MTVVEQIPIQGSFLLESRALADDRGSFQRLYDAPFLAGLGCTEPLRQANLSRTRRRGCARGMHRQQLPHCGFKLVTCLRGAIWDVCLDTRTDSPTFARWEGRTLEADRNAFILLPPGCAHGFQSLSDDTEVLYLMGEDHDPGAEVRIQMLDPELAIAWPLAIDQVSPADAGAPGLSTIFRRDPP